MMFSPQKSKVGFLSLLIVFPTITAAFLPSRPLTTSHQRYNSWTSLRNSRDDENIDNNQTTATFESSDSSSKNIVSSLTDFVNFFSKSGETSQQQEQETLPPPPSTPNELLEKIKNDYIVNNYLWTGDIFVPAFETNCKFTDPTLSFVGIDKFVQNVQNLRPIVDFLTDDDDDDNNGATSSTKSDLLDINLNAKDKYVQSRWRMIGELNTLPWKPKIDVIGRTKFWYKDVVNENGVSGVQVYFYDEEWEIPAGKALLQLVTPAGTISNGSDL